MRSTATSEEPLDETERAGPVNQAWLLSAKRDARTTHARPNRSLYTRDVVREALDHLYDEQHLDAWSEWGSRRCELRDDIVAALNRLKLQDRALLVFRAQGYTEAEAVTMVTGKRLPDKTAQKRCERALERLVDEMNGGRDWVEGLTAQRNLLDAIQPGLADEVYPPLPPPMPPWEQVPDWWEPLWPAGFVAAGPPPASTRADDQAPQLPMAPPPPLPPVTTTAQQRRRATVSGRQLPAQPVPAWPFFDPVLDSPSVAVAALWQLFLHRQWTRLARYGITKERHGTQLDAACREVLALHRSYGPTRCHGRVRLVRDARLLMHDTTRSQERIAVVTRQCPALLEAALPLLDHYYARTHVSRLRYLWTHGKLPLTIPAAQLPPPEGSCPPTAAA